MTSIRSEQNDVEVTGVAGVEHIREPWSAPELVDLDCNLENVRVSLAGTVVDGTTLVQDS